jgi:peptidoglycan-N-acetylglucosamine deacetylase
MIDWTSIIANNINILKWLYPNCIWNIPNGEQKIYLTFDDGPEPEVTPWVLAQLNQYQIKATFFCIGDNIGKHPKVFNQIIKEGHSIGNHTFHHLNGWKTKNVDYYKNVEQFQSQISNLEFLVSKLFRPPYGKIKRTQIKELKKRGYQIVMWDVISQDYNNEISPHNCLKNVVENLKPGSIIVFHDSKKAFQNLEYALPKTLEFIKEKGYRCEQL